MAKTDTPRLAVLGAGPIGLEAALYARTLNLPVTVYERGRVGEYLHNWGHVRLFSPFGMNATSLGRAAIKAGQELEGSEMRLLLTRLFACELPPHDVHGRATIVQLPREELERRFGRR